VRPAAAQVETLDRSGVAGPTGHRPEEVERVEAHGTVKDVATCQNVEGGIRRGIRLVSRFGIRLVARSGIRLVTDLLKLLFFLKPAGWLPETSIQSKGVLYWSGGQERPSC
jgi:hypothetical protein